MAKEERASRLERPEKNSAQQELRPKTRGARITVGALRLENFTVGALPQRLQDHSGYWDSLLPPYQM